MFATLLAKTKKQGRVVKWCLTVFKCKRSAERFFPPHRRPSRLPQRHRQRRQPLRPRRPRHRPVDGLRQRHLASKGTYLNDVTVYFFAVVQFLQL